VFLDSIKRKKTTKTSLGGSLLTGRCSEFPFRPPLVWKHVQIFRVNFHYLGDRSGSRNCDDEIGCPPSDDGSRKKLKSLSTFERAAAPENPPRRSARGRKQSTSKPQLRKEGRTVKGMKEWAMVSDSSESNEAYF
jgi:hypothetical protein